MWHEPHCTSAHSNLRVILSFPLAFGGFHSAQALPALLPTKGNLWVEFSRSMSFEDWIELLSSECYLFSYWKLHPHPKPFLSSVTSFPDSKFHILLNWLIIYCAVVLNLGKHDLGECCWGPAVEVQQERCAWEGVAVSWAAQGLHSCIHSQRRLQPTERWTQQTESKAFQKSKSKVLYLGQLLLWLSLIQELLQEVVA